jgi:FlaA1/EpsC-like NDP-sugar epimerase
MTPKKIKRPGTLVAKLLALPRPVKRLIMIGTDVVMITAAFWSALALKFGALNPPVLRSAGPAFVGAVVAGVVVLGRAGLYRAIVRFMAPQATSVIAVGVAASVVAAAGVDRGFGAGQVPLSAFAIFGVLALLAVTGARFAARYLLVAAIRNGGATRVLVYGAGIAGTQLTAALQASGEVRPVAFLDDNPALTGSFINGIEVHDPKHVAALVSDLGIHRVLLALPSVASRRRREILEELEPLGVRVQTVPDFANIVSGSARVEQVRDVDPVDLLGRDLVPPNRQLFDECIRGKSVMVTGAGGSIGSELCRQILGQSPATLLLFEMSELALYNIDRELNALKASHGLNVEIVSLLGNASHRFRMREILQTFAVETIYHAAAYKHVPIVEQNMIEGIHNNLFSTWQTAEAALECKVGTFVLVSTDKAVNPTNVMGATKRFAEVVVQGLQSRSGGTRFCSVRFGNVLESSGSVVPLFREQIQGGGPITVTHPDVIRYFMTIPEAAQLVIQAGSMAHGGDVFVLDMGKPIRIADLARRMIQLSGYTVKDERNPTGDIEIRYTGLRPAEKLFEELLIGKNVTGTNHPMIMRAVEDAPPWEQVHVLLDELDHAARRFDCRAAREILQRAVREYVPLGDAHDFVWARRPAVAALPALVAGEGKVTELSARRLRQPPSLRD